MRRLIWKDASDSERYYALRRPAGRVSEALRKRVHDILDDVDSRGQEAVQHWAQELDGYPIKRVDAKGIARAAEDALGEDDLAAIRAAHDAILTFHEAQKPRAADPVETAPGVLCQRVWRPLGTVGLYIPGGSAPLLSTLLMLVVPAKVAGVSRIVAATPPGEDGELDPAIAAAARISELEEIWLVGGAQAIAAMSFGAGNIPRCDKIFGPGNAWVAEAKRQASECPGGPAIDMPAGPSELMVIADDSADPAVVAADLLSQAEHDADAQIVLASLSERLELAVRQALEEQLEKLPRSEIARKSLAHALCIACESREEALGAAESYAPEHLSLNVDYPDALAEAVRCAGTVFVGARASESFGDYCAGPNHVLPTDGAARAWSGLSVDSFMRTLTLQRVTEEGANALAPVAARLARLEGLEAHARSAEIRA